jgi:hypothetical protein
MRLVNMLNPPIAAIFAGVVFFLALSSQAQDNWTAIPGAKEGIGDGDSLDATAPRPIGCPGPSASIARAIPAKRLFRLFLPNVIGFPT